ncbi:DUF5686 and carboxypeptidase regulatory-like domain-containing protein [Halosquirtibacter laminarini]|uniref:DUF5686 and carboxypeptidase regulatory-like domain-containing protein n=1 Tax=Halosquirtibacter laminarini TaxID=3374600 RepID=A0AC61NGG5_9BACT|nr:DUF5686 and carboxypeptidase regulatory-like domain-containing protein [Prolixibacteraceae bacterium]
MRYLFLCCIFLSSLISLFAFDVKGLLKSSSGESIPYATIYVSSINQGTTTNIDGQFILSLPSKKRYKALIRCLGYKSKTIVISPSQNDSIFVVLDEEKVQISEVSVINGEDPAYDIMRKTIGLREKHLTEINFYKANIYLRGTVSFSKVSKLMSYQIKKREGIKIKKGDVFVDESYRQVIFNAPDSYKQKVIQHKSSLPMDFELPIKEFLGASIYQPSIEIMISPFSPSAFRHYRFRYEGFFYEGDYSVNIVKVIPRKSSKQLYSGKVYIVDGLWCIHSLDLSFDTPVGVVQMKQNFHEIKNNVWLPVDHHYSFEGGALGIKGDVKYVANIRYLDVSLNKIYHPKEENVTVADVDNSSELDVPQKNERDLNIENKSSQSIAKIESSSVVHSPIQKRDHAELIAARSFDISSYQTMPLDSFRSVPLTSREENSLQKAKNIPEFKGDRVGDLVSNSNNSFLKKSYDFLSGTTYYKNDSLFRVKSPNMISISSLVYNPVDQFAYHLTSEFAILKEKQEQFVIKPMIGYSFGLDKIDWNLKMKLNYTDNSSLNFEGGEVTRDFNRYTINPLTNSITSFFFGKNYKKYYRDRSYMLSHYTFSKSKWRNTIHVKYNQLEQVINSIESNPFGKHFDSNISDGYYITSKSYESQDFIEVGTKFGVFMNFLDNKNQSQYRTLRVYPPYLTASYNYIFSPVNNYNVHSLEFNVYQKIKTSPSSWIRFDLNGGKMFGDTEMLHLSRYFNYEIQPVPLRLDNQYFSFYNADGYSFASNDSYLKSKFIYRTPYLLLKYLPFLSSSLSREEISCGVIYTPREQYYEASYAFTELLFLFDIYVTSSFNSNGFDHLGVSLVIDL